MTNINIKYNIDIGLLLFSFTEKMNLFLYNN